jgi:uncharacterized protein YecA (UPF0149 family)
MKTVNRNDLCSCGSGKKYKKCCLTNKIVQLSDLISTEIVEQQDLLLNYAVSRYEDAIRGNLEEFPLEETPEEVQTVFYHFAILQEIFLSNRKPSIVEEFIKTQGSRIKRPRIKEIVESWNAGFPSFVRIEKKHSDTQYEVVEMFSNRKFSIKLLQERPFKEHELLFGFIVPFESSFTIFSEVLNFEGEDAVQAEKSIRDLYKEVGEEEEMEDFYSEWLLETVETFIFGTMDDLLEELEWENEMYKLIATILKQRLEGVGVPSSIVRIGITLWFQYCELQPPARIPKPMIYVAALEYIVMSFIVPEHLLVKKEIAEEVGISVSSLSSKIKDLEKVLGDSILAFKEAIEQTEEDEDDELEGYVDPFLEDDDNFESDSLDDDESFLLNQKERLHYEAQQMVFEVVNEGNRAKRKRVAQEALSIYQDCSDAYVVLAEEERDPKKKLSIYEKGLEAAERHLGTKFIQENKGHFWLVFETRPLMRVKLELAKLLLEFNKTNESIKHMEELLELNPNDSQGVRYILTEAYFKAEEYQKADSLLKRFDLHDAHTAYSKVFIHYKLKGINKTTEKLLKTAREVNPHVIPYLQKEKKLPKKPPEYIGFGDETEAISYLFDYAKYWWNETQLINWLN